MRRRYKHISMLMRTCCCMLLMLFISMYADAQPVMRYTVRDGKMFITLDKDLPKEELEGFIKQFDLQNLALDRFLKNGFADSLKKAGWKIEMDTRVGIAISKPLASFQEINNPADRILFTSRDIPFDALFPSVSNLVKYGYNRFRNKYSFAIIDSVVFFFLRGNTGANKVMLAGSFNDWNPDALSMQRTDSGWVAGVKLKPGKYWYKFIVNGNWITDPDNRNNENDGLGNTNSVFYYTNTIFYLDGYTNAKKVILGGSFNNWDQGQPEMERTQTGWKLPLYLADGTHTYRFSIDRKWLTDPSNPNKLPNGFGEYNSVIKLGDPYLFKLDGYTNAKEIRVTGTFNSWKKDELFMERTAGGWQLPYVLAPGNYQYRFLVDGKEMNDPANPSLVNDKRANSILILKPNYTFRLKGYENAKKVLIAGDFNDWNQDGFAMKKVNDEWVITMHLSPGKHLYKFIVDGKWIIDPGNKLWEKNEHNTGNSVIWLEK